MNRPEIASLGGKMSKEEESVLTAIVIGAGMRGSVYAQYAHSFPSRLKIVGVAEPRKFYRRKLQNCFDIPEQNCFSDWSDASKRDKMSDCVIITTPDRLHKDPAVAFAKKGYHILLEKPMAVNEEDCREIVETCKENGVTLAICHVLRYTPWAQKLRELIDSGVIGEVVNINHTEPPPGSASRCMDCPSSIESKCPYSAKRIYLDEVKQFNTGWPVCVITEEPTIESVTTALKTGPYGVCVYDNDNDVMSNQVVNMQFEGGATATLTMMAFTQSVCTREVKIYGTKGQLSCVATGSPIIKHSNFVTEKTHEYRADAIMQKGMSGHGGADFHCIHSFVSSIINENPADILTGPDESLTGHLLVFAAEKARKENRVVTLQSDGTYN
ncbi:myo-inositol 2-dehydrogenase-like isoform X5 [Argopecten irradians]|uniref:myo-inositol 2-dehydrogenase-like isoform X5 n=1 Tax=Argopecten irradians TaxID=31199 RepID=UPI003723050B